MLTNRLQNVLFKRIELMQELLMISTYSEILSLKLKQYRDKNDRQSEIQRSIIQIYKNTYHIDEHFRKSFYQIVCSVFSKINKRFRQGYNKNKSIGRMHNIYLDFIYFFKIQQENYLIKYMKSIDIQTYSEIKVVCFLSDVLIKYLKIKTQLILIKLQKQHQNIEQNTSLTKSMRENIQYRQQSLSNQFKNQNMSNTTIKLNKVVKRKPNLLKTENKNDIRKFKSYSFDKKIEEIVPPLSAKRQRLSLSISIKQSSNLQSNRLNFSETKDYLRGFKRIYNEEWRKYLEQFQSLDLEELASSRFYEQNEKKEWIYNNFNKIFYECCSRNQLIVKNIQAYEFHLKNLKQNQPKNITNGLKYDKIGNQQKEVFIKNNKIDQLRRFQSRLPSTQVQKNVHIYNLSANL